MLTEEEVSEQFNDKCLKIGPNLGLFFRLNIYSVYHQILLMTSFGMFITWGTEFTDLMKMPKFVLHRFLPGREPWSSGYGMRLMFQRLWV